MSYKVIMSTREVRMESLKLNILLEHLNLECKYHLKDGEATFCERAWEREDVKCLKYVNCGGVILQCELVAGSVMRYIPD